MAHRCPCGSLILCSLKEGGWKLKSSEEGRCHFRRGAAKNRRGAQRHAMSLWMKPASCQLVFERKRFAMIRPQAGPQIAATTVYLLHWMYACSIQLHVADVSAGRSRLSIERELGKSGLRFFQIKL